MTKRRTIPALMAATLGLGATAAWAEQPQAAGAQQDMQKQIEALQAQISQLQAQQAQRAVAPAYTAKDVDATVSSVLSDADRRSQLLADGGGLGAGWMDGGFRLRSADGNYELQPFAQFQFRHVLNLTDGGEDAEGDTDFDSGEGFEVRRMKFGIQGVAVSPKLGYHFRWATNRDGGSLILEQAYVTYAFADNMKVKAGQWKDNWTHEESVSSGRQLAVDRSLLNEMIAGGETDYIQGVALIWDGGALRGELAWHDGANSDNTNFQDSGANFGISGRLEGLLQGDWKQYDDFSTLNNKKSLLAIGGGFDWTQAGDTNVFYHTFDVQWEGSGGLGAYGAYVGRWVDLGGADDDSVCDFGILGQVGYLFNRDWELFGRGSWVMLDDEFLAPDAEENVLELTIGVNYFIRGHNAKFSIDGTWLPNGSPENHPGIGVVGQDSDDNQFILRTQFQLMI